MIALQIHHNDVPLCLAGASDLVVLNAIVNAIGQLGPETVDRRKADTGDEGSDAPEDEGPAHFFLSVGGLTARRDSPDEHLRWVEHAPVLIGDRITITLVESDEADPPSGTMQRRDMHDEKKEYIRARQTYLRLRHKYGDPDEDS